MYQQNYFLKKNFPTNDCYFISLLTNQFRFEDLLNFVVDLYLFIPIKMVK